MALYASMRTACTIDRGAKSGSINSGIFEYVQYRKHVYRLIRGSKRTVYPFQKQKKKEQLRLLLQSFVVILTIYYYSCLFEREVCRDLNIVAHTIV